MPKGVNSAFECKEVWTVGVTGMTIGDQENQVGAAVGMRDKDSVEGCAIQGLSETWAELHVGLAAAQSGIALLSGTSSSI